MTMPNQWQGLRDKHENETGLLICNGPSLSAVPLTFLDSYCSFGLNRIYLLEEFAPTYYLAADKLFIETCEEELREWLVTNKDITTPFIREPYATLFPGAISFVRTEPCWSMSPEKFLGRGGSGSYLALQIMYMMGFTVILIVGLDHDYFGAPHRHFHPDYLKDLIHWPPGTEGKRQIWESGTKLLLETGFGTARQVFEDRGGSVINLSPTTKLEVFEKGNINDF